MPRRTPLVDAGFIMACGMLSDLLQDRRILVHAGDRPEELAASARHGRSACSGMGGTTEACRSDNSEDAKGGSM